MFSIPAYHIPQWALKGGELKTDRDSLMDIKCAEIHILYLIRGFTLIIQYQLSNLLKDKTQM